MSLAVSVCMLLTTWFSALPLSAQGSIEVDLALVLAVDCSNSVDNSEFDLQMQGLARAFVNPAVIAAIKQGGLGRITVMVVQWSDLQSQKIVVPWTIVSDDLSAHQFAESISATPRLTAGETSISGVINFGIFLLMNNPVSARRHVIDISGDGIENNGIEPPDAARDRAVTAGITINGLAILNEYKKLDAYFHEHVVGGAGSFVLVATDYRDYGDAIIRKLLQEILGQKISRYIP
jgi:hypothetical protein